MLADKFLITFTSRIFKRASTFSNVRVYSSNSSKIPRNPLQDIFSATQQKTNGVIYDKKPFKITLETGKNYSWCLCGKSKTQPLCDGTHKDIYLKIVHRPIKFTVPETKEYWLCNCKQTKNRPFCDGTHKNEEIQGAATRV